MMSPKLLPIAYHCYVTGGEKVYRAENGTISNKGNETMSTESELSLAAGERPKMREHPAAKLFPMMSEEEFRRLKNDIEKNGLRHAITITKI
jgi:hypothetical protein